MAKDLSARDVRLKFKSLSSNDIKFIHKFETVVTLCEIVFLISSYFFSINLFSFLIDIIFFIGIGKNISNIFH